MRVLVAGSAGFIGKHVCRALAGAGHDVYPLDWPDVAQHLPERLHDCVDAIVNLAAIGGVSRAKASPAHVMSNNVGAAIALRSWAEAEIQLPVVVQISSFSVYGAEPPPWHEGTPVSPKEIYGASKACQELAWVGYPGAIATLRLSSVYGSGMRIDDPGATVIAKIRKAARDGEEFQIYEDGHQERDFVHVDDVAACGVAAIAELWDSAAAAEPARMVVNVCSGEKVSILKACELLGARYKILNVARAGDMRDCSALWPERMVKLLGRDPKSFFYYFKDVG